MRDTYSYDQKNCVVEEKKRYGRNWRSTKWCWNNTNTRNNDRYKKEVDGYKSAGYSVTRLLQHSDLAKVIRISQFRGDNSWIQYLGEEQSKLLIENFDVLVNEM